MNGASGIKSCSKFFSMAARPLRQTDIKKEDNGRHHEGTQPPSNSFSKLAVTKDRSTATNNPATDHARGKVPMPDLAHGQEHQERGQQHGQRHGDAVGGRQIVGRAERDGQHERERHQEPIDEADIDLPIALGGGLLDVQARTQSELDCLASSSKTRR